MVYVRNSNKAEGINKAYFTAIRVLYLYLARQYRLKDG